MKHSICRLALSTMFWLLVCSGVQAQVQRNAILAIDVAQPDSRIEVRIKLRMPPATSPVHFSTTSPARIVIDFSDTDNTVDARPPSAETGVLRGVTVATSAGRSRIVLNLKHMPPYAVRTEADTVIVAIAGNEALPVSSSGSNSNSRPLIGSIDFRRGAQGEGRILIDLPGPETALDIRRQGLQIVADILNAGLPTHSPRRLDVSDFGTPVKTIAGSSRGADVRLLIDTEAQAEYHAYQKDAQLVIEVRTPADTGKGPAQRHQLYRGDKLSLQFQNIDVRAILQVLADFTGINIIASDGVGGALTLRLKEVPWDQALDIVLQARGLDMRRNGNVMWVAPREELLMRERLELEQRAQIAELEPLRAEVFQLNYQKADAFRKVFGEDATAGISPNSERRPTLLSRRGSAVVDQRTNQLFVTDTPSVLDNIRKLLEKIDVAARQVLIEARIVEADDSFSRNLGARLGFSARTNGVAAGSTYNQAGEVAGLTKAAANSYTANHAVNLPAQGIGGAAAGSFALSLFNAAANRFLTLELSALEADGKGKIVSSPRVVTADQQPALIEQGEEIPYQQATSSGATSTAFKKANLKLEVTPQITPDGNVILNVDINKDSRGTATPGGLAINTKHVRTLVQVENGGTVVIGGIYTQTESNTVSKVPLLGDIPILGNLFKHSARIDHKTELLIFLTPKIVADRNFLR
ncbi:MULTISPECIES: type IV pilus secretin PilQ [unclassified Herbaspirillum]|uniref:type IV pilus secretin PilQ n=1 Tax=unclassified Herbaspirillum TaxID=2624150 RepID=UPI000E2ECCA6|nr:MULTISPECIES: type IV pilus secretin PilQ [unclassified Herbaspirillum]RFB70976.1 type IV pilus secretin PilQ [Herbaspirillum sp. 3R-3a1]TFI08499.1 type IV pilus secretin PilQ [Herbaspirillum sp. 3R11]TFI14913.1 type IV pilus secretin PilQ [Herbaspirillum sp. 3R-11]TFI25138.1 type IV pilus secretin PilQ [Herbaspirillum sp. 3C11]